jgi:CNT family concentrative nucleoside transporter
LLIFLALAWLLSEDRKHVNWRFVAWGSGLQLALGVLFLWTPLKGPVFSGMQRVVDVLTESTMEGANFVFGTLPPQAALAFQVLPVIIVVTALSTILYHLHVVQAIVRVVSWVMRRTLKTSGAETLGVALLIFIGIEGVSAIRAYLANMTRSELCTIMTTFMATIAGSVMILYAGMGAEAGHLLSASLMSAPAAILISKIMVPETETPATAGATHVAMKVDTHNVLDAAAQGTADGLRMALNVGAMLIVFIALVHLLNLILGATVGLSFQDIAAWVFWPFAFLMGIPSSDVSSVAQLIGTKTVLNEFLAYQALKPMVEEQFLQPRSTIIATYALCGFANPGSIGIMIAGLDSLIPGRRAEVSSLCVKAFIGGTLACFTTACIAGILIDG